MNESTTAREYVAFCINLDSRPDRWEHMQKVAAYAGITVQRIAGVDRDDPKWISELTNMPDNGPLGPIGLGSLCCTLAHRQAWYALLDTDVEWGLILEDDLSLDSRAAEVVAEIVNVSDASIPLLKLECGRDGLLTKPLARHLSSEHILFELRHMSPGAGCYLIHRTAAARLVEKVSSSRVPVDHFLFYPRKTPFFANERYGVLNPALAMQDKALKSDISGFRYGDRSLLFHLTRGWHEARQLPLMLKLLLAGWRVRKIRFDSNGNMPS